MVIGVKLKPNIRGSNWFERKILFYLFLFRNKPPSFFFFFFNNFFFQNQNNKNKLFFVFFSSSSSSSSFRLEHSRHRLQA